MDEIVEAGLAPEERGLTPRELAAYRYELSHPQARLTPDTQARLFALYLNGNDCWKISRLNNGLRLGEVVRARIEGRWDERRKEHLEQLLDSTRARVQQVTLEGIEFLADQLAAAHKLHGDSLKRFLSSGDPEDLGTWSIHGFSGYKAAVELLKAFTGQDSKQVRGEFVHRHVAETPLEEQERPRALTSQDATSAIRAALAVREAAPRR